MLAVKNKTLLYFFFQMVKNERINIIRKQYDAFLEEDKKRRERNEYILGKLDKMRSSTALVPISTNINYSTEPNSSDLYIRPDYGPNNSMIFEQNIPHLERPKMALDMLNKHIDESSILKEISKKYILIPKRGTFAGEEYSYHKEKSDDSDWKNKYNILEQLKKQEKEGQSETVLSKNNGIYQTLHKDFEQTTLEKQPSESNHFDKPLHDKNNVFSKIYETNDMQKQEENKNINNIKFEISNSNNQNNEEHRTALQSITTLDEGIKNNQSNHITENDRSDYPITHEMKKSQEEYVTEKEKYNSDINEKNENYGTEIKNNNLQTNNINLSKQEPNNEETISSPHFHQEPEHTGKYLDPSRIIDTTIQQASDINEKLNTEVCSEQNTDFYRNPKEERESYDINNLPTAEGAGLCNQLDNPDTTQNYQETQENSPVALDNTEQSEFVDHDTEINAFEAEQKDMFYSEQAGGDNYSYTQGDGNTGEYTTDGYEKNDQYAYYEGVQQEQGYDNINEHEESTERYDPHYNQQYEGSYDNQQVENTNYENTNAYDQQQYPDPSYENQQYENVVTYDNQQNNENLQELQENNIVSQENQIYDQHLYTEQEHEHIEQQLVTEEGYEETSPVIEMEKEIEGETETIMNTAPTAEQLPDPKVL